MRPRLSALMVRLSTTWWLDLHTLIPPCRTIIDRLHEIETDAGRVRGAKAFDNRILDIDVILYGDENWRDRGINVPRDEIERYAYVLKPLADLYPRLVHPLIGRSMSEMWSTFEDRNQTRFMAQVALGRRRLIAPAGKFHGNSRTMRE